MSKPIYVSDLKELYAALGKVKGDETILLEGGNYGTLAMTMQSKFKLDFPGNVTIKSADPRDPAVFTGLDLRGVSNLTLDGVTFDYKYAPGHPLYARLFDVSNSENVTIRNSVFDGDTVKKPGAFDDGLGSGIGLSIRGSDNVVVENNEIFGFFRGLVMGGGTDNVVRGNEFYDIRMDGMNFAAVQGIVIEDNYLHDFRRSTDPNEHSDMIQFFTSGTTRPSTDIVIRGNTLDIGEGDATQSIFMRNDVVDRGLAGKEMFYRNVLIEDNVIYNGHQHGISVGETIGLTIRNNSVLQADGRRVDGKDAGVETPKISVADASTGVVITGNAVAGILGKIGQPGWTVVQNAFVQNQDPLKPGYYADVFITSTLTPNGGVNEFVALPGGMIDRLKAGAEGTAYEKVTDRLEARFNAVEPDDNGAVRVFDAGVTSSQFKTLPAGTQFLWDFGDGTTGRGAVVSHAFADGGTYTVKLTVRLPDGKSDVQVSRIDVAGPKILEMGTKGEFMAFEKGVGRIVEAGDASTEAGLQLDTKGVAAFVDRESLRELLVSDNFQIEMTLKADSDRSEGEVFRLNKSFFAAVTPAGEMQFNLVMADGKTVVATTRGADLDDRQEHAVKVSFDDGKLKLYIDGKLNVSVNAPGTMSTEGTGGLLFGNPWGRDNFEGDVKAFKLSVDADDYQPGPGPRQTPAPAGPIASAPPEAPADPLHAAGFKGLVIDADDAASLKGLRFIDDAATLQTKAGKAIVLDGEKDFVSIGKVASVEKSDQIAFSIDFARDSVGDDPARLVWNHLKLGLTLAGDGIIIQAMTEDEGFKQFKVDKLGLADTDLHRATVMVDAESDRMQVIVDSKVVLDVKDTDFDFSGADRGWTIGTAWNRFFDGNVSEFRLGDRFEFLDGQQPQGDALQS